MAVKISGVLKDGTGKPVQNCTIQLKAKRNSTTVVVNTLASENPDEAGRYSMDVEYGQYSVILLVEGFPPSHAGTITVYEDSRPGTLNDFLGAMTEDDARPEALRRFELMVEEVARNASAVAQNTACQCRENVRNECGSVTTISSHFCIHRDHESVRSCHLSPGCVSFKRGGKIIRNERSLERQQRSFLGNGDSKFREGGKNVRDERQVF